MYFSFCLFLTLSSQQQGVYGYHMYLLSEREWFFGLIAERKKKDHWKKNKLWKKTDSMLNILDALDKRKTVKKVNLTQN